LNAIINVMTLVPTLLPVVESDFDDMVTLRIEALRESLERLGRYDPTRARARLADGFSPLHMHHIEVNGERVGFVTLRPDDVARPPSLRLHHLYIRPGAQGRGTGEWVLNWAKRQAVAAGRGITLSALKLSDANRFYLRHGFVEVGQSDFDVDYHWSVLPAAALVDAQ
jgi:GNAT superfamily N-acetyltransferase